MISPNQKNLLLKAIELQKSSPKDFTLDVKDKEVRITHKATGFHFRIKPTQVQNGEIRLFIYQIPFKEGPVFNAEKEYSNTGPDTWEKAIAFMSNWLVLIKQEFEVPDLWAELEQEPDVFAEGAELPEDAFTPAEIKLLEARIATVEQEIIDLNLPPDAEAAITKAIKEVPKKAKRLTKKEVGEILFSTVMREGLKALLSKDNMVAVWHALYHLFTLAIS